MGETIYRHVMKPTEKKAYKFTLAFSFDHKAKIIHVGVAVCSRKDQFNRATGRLISHGRSISMKEKGTRLLNIYGHDYWAAVSEPSLKGKRASSTYAEINARILDVVNHEISHYNSLQNAVG